MGEFNKDPNQGGSGKQQQGDKPAFGQFEKGQQGQEEFGGEKGGQSKEQFGQGKEQAGQQYAEEKLQTPQEKQEEQIGGKGGQQQFEDKGERQQGDEDLDEDSKSQIDNQGLK